MGDHSGMLDTRRQAEPQTNQALLDRRLAYLLLRLTLGLNMLLHGAVRLPALGASAEGTVQQFAGTPLPAVAVRLFGLSLPFLETACNTREAMQGGVCVDTITSCETQLMKPGVTRTHVETTGQTGQTRL